MCGVWGHSVNVSEMEAFLLLVSETPFFELKVTEGSLLLLFCVIGRVVGDWLLTEGVLGCVGLFL